MTSSYKNSFFKDRDIAVTTCRAGNVIGGGDFAKDRIIPDCLRAVREGRDIVVRNPDSTRPYQHVLEPVFAYLMIAASQYEDMSVAGSYNVGPDDSDCRTTGELVQLFCDKWNATCEDGDPAASWRCENDGGPHEAGFLKLDCSLIKRTFEWSPCWNIETAMEKIVEWSRAYFDGKRVAAVMDRQIKEYINT